MNDPYNIDLYLDTVADACFMMDFSTFDDTVSWLTYDPLIGSSWTKRTLKMIDDINKSKLTYRQVGLLFPSISQLRNMMLFDMWMSKYGNYLQNDREKIFKFYTRILVETMVEDPHASNYRNIIHTSSQVVELSKNIKTANEKIARDLGRIVNICYHFGHAAFADMNPSTCYENYGPYDVGKIFRQGYSLVVKEFNNFRPVELWPSTKNIPCDNIHLITVYEDVVVKVDNISHVTYEGDIIKNLKYYRLLVDEKNYPIEKIDEIINPIARQTIEIFEKFQSLDFESRKAKFFHQKAYVYKKIFDKLGQDWKPAREILSEANSKKLHHVKWPKSKKSQINLFKNILDPRVDLKEVPEA